MPLNRGFSIHEKLVGSERLSILIIMYHLPKANPVMREKAFPYLHVARCFLLCVILCSGSSQDTCVAASYYYVLFYVVVVLKILTSSSTGGVTALSLFGTGIIFPWSWTVRRLSFSTNIPSITYIWRQIYLHTIRRMYPRIAGYCTPYRYYVL